MKLDLKSITVQLDIHYSHVYYCNNINLDFISLYKSYFFILCVFLWLMIYFLIKLIQNVAL